MRKAIDMQVARPLPALQCTCTPSVASAVRDTRVVLQPAEEETAPSQIGRLVGIDACVAEYSARTHWLVAATRYGSTALT